MGVTLYGQMTAGSYCYIGPQGIVHGTTVNIIIIVNIIIAIMTCTCMTFNEDR